MDFQRSNQTSYYAWLYHAIFKINELLLLLCKLSAIYPPRHLLITHLPQFIIKLYHRIRFRKLGIKLGYSIGKDVFGYGLILSHHGTIVEGASNRIGNFSVLHTSTCITDNTEVIGDALYLSTGAKLTSKLILGNNVSIGANSLVNKSFGSNCMIAGAPAKFIKTEDSWYVRDGKEYSERVNRIIELKREFGIAD